MINRSPGGGPTAAGEHLTTCLLSQAPIFQEVNLMKFYLIRMLILCVSLLLLATMPASAQGDSGGVITFQGQLSDGNGAWLNGAYDLRFAIYGAENDGAALWGPETHNSVPVQEGQFVVQLGSVTPLDGAIFNGNAHWLEMAVWNGAAWEPLSPRLLMGGAAYALSAASLPPGTILSGSGDAVLSAINTSTDTQLLENQRETSEPPTLVGLNGQSEHGTGVLGISNSHNLLDAGVMGLSRDPTGYAPGVYGKGAQYGVVGVTNATKSLSSAVYGKATATSGWAAGGFFETYSADNSAAGLYGKAMATSGRTYGVKGITNSSTDGAAGVYGVFGHVTYRGQGYGVMGETDSSTDGTAGVYGKAIATSGGTFGGYFTNKSADGAGVYAEASSSTGTTYGVYATTKSTGNNTAAVQGWADASGGRVYGMHGSTRSSGEGAAGVYGEASATSGQTYGGHFKVASSAGAGIYGEASGAGVGVKAMSEQGNVIEGYAGNSLVFKVDHSGNVFADGTYQSPAADFAELLPGAEGLEAGDVLAVDASGHAVKASVENSLAIIGVYSTDPAFLGGAQSAIGNPPSRIPVAIIGVVPVKASTENGPIRAGDPLTVSSKAGYAAKATPLFVLDGGEGVYAGGSIVGRALQGLDSGEGVIQVLLQLR